MGRRHLRSRRRRVVINGVIALHFLREQLLEKARLLRLCGELRVGAKGPFQALRPEDVGLLLEPFGGQIDNSDALLLAGGNSSNIRPNGLGQTGNASEMRAMTLS